MDQSTHQDPIIAGNFFDKYGSKNPIVKIMMGGFFRSFDGLLSGLPVESAVEVGCGEGEIGKRLMSLFPDIRYEGLDVSPQVVQEARRRYPSLKFEVVSVYDIRENQFAADLIVASEVFEHLDTPDLGMAALLRTKFEYLLVSVPREPIWRILNVARGKYLANLGNTPGHVNHWSRKGFERFLHTFSSDLEILKMASPFPWTMVLLRRR